MNFGKAKKILIFLFLFLNLFLIFQLTQLSNNETSLNTDSIDKTIALLNKNNISADEKNIPKHIEILDFLELYNPLTNIGEFSEKINQELKQVNNQFSLSLNLKIEKETPEEIIKKIQAAGFKNYAFSFQQSFENPVTGEKKYYFNQVHNGFAINGATVCADVKNNTITALSGNVYDVLRVNYTEYTIISPLHILIDIASSYQGNGATLNAIEQAYYIPSENKNFQNLTAIPCYIIDIDSHLFYYDAVTGDFLLMISKDGIVFNEKQTAFSLL